MCYHLEKQNQCTVSERNGQLVFLLNSEILLPENAPVRLTSAQLEELDYRELYRAYSGMIRKTQVEPRILFEILVCAYARNVYSGRKIRQLCEENTQFILLLDGHAAPDYSTIARLRSGKETGKAIENLFTGTIICRRKPENPTARPYSSTEPSRKARRTDTRSSGEKRSSGS